MPARCSDCKVTQSTRRLAVDHNHATGAIRGLLCNRCNVMVGMALDDPERLGRAAAYLRIYELV